MGVGLGFLIAVSFAADSQVHDMMHTFQAPLVHTTMEWITLGGRWWLLLMVGSAMAGAGWLAASRGAVAGVTLRHAGLSALLGILSANVCTRVAKRLIGRARPFLLDQGITHWGPSLTIGFDSLPSGHATTAVAFATVLWGAYPRLRPWVVLYATVVCLSRLYLDVHFLTDVLAGALVGVIVTRWVVARWDRWLLQSR